MLTAAIVIVVGIAVLAAMLAAWRALRLSPGGAHNSAFLHASLTTRVSRCFYAGDMAVLPFGLAVALALVGASRAFAQTAEAQNLPARDGLAVGASVGPALAGGAGFWPAVRVSTPLAARVGLDVDAGGMFPRDNGYFRSRWFYALQLRFLTRPRGAERSSSRFWVVGPVLITGASFDGEGHLTDGDARIGAIRIAYGGDRLYANGMRAGGEIGLIGGGSSAPTGIHAGLTIQWRPRR